MTILAIETSCDETAAAVVQSSGYGVRVISNVVASQIDIHKVTGGVIPDVASREHVRQMIPVVSQAMRRAHTMPRKLSAIAVTNRPGLLSALTIGVETAKTLATVWKKPLIPVHHIAGHISANWIVPRSHNRLPAFPCLGLVVSGGHTELVWMKKLGDMRIVGRTRDDAAGEAFDKVARLLGLSYPGGPVISKEARFGNPNAIAFPRAMMEKGNLDFSFSGLKTSVRYHVADRKLRTSEIRDIAASFQEAVVDALVQKTVRAIERFEPMSVVLAGGVAANRALRTRLRAETRKQHLAFFMPEFRYCTDNAAMIGAAALLFGKPLASPFRVRAIAQDPFLLTNKSIFRRLKQ